MKFKVKSGVHYQGPKKFVKGDTVESASDLTITFVNKFEKVVEEETQAPVVNANASNDTDKKEEVAPVDAKDENVADTGSTDDDTAKETEGGIDVSAEYEIAVENKIKVIRSKGWYNLFDTVEDGAKINESGLRAAAVEAAIEDYLKDED